MVFLKIFYQSELQEDMICLFLPIHNYLQERKKCNSIINISNTSIHFPFLYLVNLANFILKTFFIYRKEREIIHIPDYLRNTNISAMKISIFSNKKITSNYLYVLYYLHLFFSNIHLFIYGFL